MTKSKAFFYFCLAFILGVCISSFFCVPSAVITAKAGIQSFVLGGVVIFALILISVWREYKKAVLAGFFLLFFVFGIARHQQVSRKGSNIQDNQVSFYNEETITFEGVVKDYPDERTDKTQIVVRVGTVNEKKSQGNILVFVQKYSEMKYGDKVKIICEIKDPGEFDGFSYANYLAKSDIYSVCYQPKSIALISEGNGNKFYTVILKIKNSFKYEINKVFPEPSAGILRALFLGDKGGISQSIKDDFALIGISHIIAISGYHVAIIVGFFSLILLQISLSQKKSFWITILFILFFVFLTGAGASVVRAGVMGAIMLAAINSGRISKAKNAIVFAGVIMLISNPLLLRFDLGFILSFAAALGIIYFLPILERLLFWVPEKLGMRAVLAVALSAQLAVMPIVIFNFDKLSLVSPLSNFLVLPFIPLIMFLGFTAVLFGFLNIILGKIIGFFAWIFLAVVIKTVKILARMPFVSVKINFLNWYWIGGYYILLICLYLLVKSKCKSTNQNSKIK